MPPTDPYYRRDLALVHHRGFGFHADRCAPGILEILDPVLARGGLVLEIGCGSGLLTRHLVDAGHRVIATDASPPMLDLARESAPGAEEIRQLTLPGDPVPPADAIVGVGHPLNYLPTRADIERALRALARALRPGGVLVLDLCDLEWARSRLGDAPLGRVGDDWAIVSEFDVPDPEHFVRRMAVFLRNDDGTWRRDDERHDNVMVETSSIPALLATEGVTASVRSAFGDEELPRGLHVIVGRRESVP